MSSYTRTARRAHQRKAGNANTALRSRGKRAPRPFVASMLTTVDWPVFVVEVKQTLTQRDYRERYGVSRKQVAAARAEWLDQRRETRENKAMDGRRTRFMTGVFDAMKRAGAQQIDLRNAA